MKLKELGEFKLLELITERFGSSPRAPGILGIGDDCAVIPWSDETSLLVTTDMLVSGTHFLDADILPEDLGHKSLAVNISDIAAMGGKPRFAFLSIGLPPTLELTWAESFFGGFQKLADKFGISLLGGDTIKSTQVTCINVCLLGEACTQDLKLRSNARNGDLVCLTDFVGDSAAGLKIILQHLPRGDIENFLVSRHYRPEPQVAAGQWLSKQPGVHAMMDVSDGIDSDLRRILERSNCGADINLEDIPLSQEIQNFCSSQHVDPAQLGISGGEDYCLLFTTSPEAIAKLQADYAKEFGKDIYVVGKCTNKPGQLSYFRNSELFLPNQHGYDGLKS